MKFDPVSEELAESFSVVSEFDLRKGYVQRDRGRRWSRKGHQMEECFVSPDKKWAYINIPKNSSTSIKLALESIGWEIFNHSELKQFNAQPKYLVVLRDPVTRWISGIAEYLTMYHSDAIDELSSRELNALPLLGQRLGLDLIFDRFCFDDHTDLQCSFIEGLPFNRCEFIFIDRKLEENLNKFLFNNNYEVVLLGNENSAEFGTARNLEVKLGLQNLIKMILERSENKRRALHEYLWADLELIKTVKFIT